MTAHSELTGKLFERLDWQRSYTVAEGRVTVTWFSETLAAVGFLEALIFPCGYEELDTDYYFNVDNWTLYSAITKVTAW